MNVFSIALVSTLALTSVATAQTYGHTNAGRSAFPQTEQALSQDGSFGEVRTGRSVAIDQPSASPKNYDYGLKHD
jgi:hypothetical protein